MATALFPASTTPENWVAAECSGSAGGSSRPATLARPGAEHTMLSALGYLRAWARDAIRALDAKPKPNKKSIEWRVRTLTEGCRDRKSECMRSSTSASLVRVPNVHERDMGLELMALKVKSVQSVVGGTLTKGHTKHENVGRPGRGQARAQLHSCGRSYEVGSRRIELEQTSVVVERWEYARAPVKVHA
ncbi:hypothetical protein BDV93DRAFT_513877 [Ceratobasidium sp. AG-I]|nr:hypothetical protein BDV93DRAFT_513877 [Ceratobasidium sp. AG-I]